MAGLSKYVFILGMIMGASGAYQALPWPDRLPASKTPEIKLKEIEKVQTLENLANQIPSFEMLDLSSVLDAAAEVGVDPHQGVKSKNSPEIEASWTVPSTGSSQNTL